MPTYEFRCPAGHDFERFYRKISDATAEVQCPECGQIAERRMSAGGGLLFKGSGFYITDYGKDGKKGMTPPAKASGESAGGGEPTTPKSESAGGEAKPAGSKDPPKSESKPAPKKSKPSSE
jgi:putative FmdB family regulatory protein